MRVISVENDRLVTNAGNSALNDITSVETREHDATRTWILVGGLLVDSYLLLEAELERIAMRKLSRATRFRP